MKHVYINNFLYPNLSASLPRIYAAIILATVNAIRIVDLVLSQTLYTTSITTAKYNVIVSTISEIREKANKYSQTFFCVVQSCLMPAHVFLYTFCVACITGSLCSLNQSIIGSINIVEIINAGRNT